MHYVNTHFFFVNCLLEKIKYVVIESSYFWVIKIKRSKNWFFFLKDKKLKKLAVALKLYTHCFKFKFEYFLLAPLHKSLKTMSHLKPRNSEILFLLSALKMPIKSVISYQVAIK